MIGSSLFLSLTTMNSSSLEWNTPVSPCAEARAHPSYLPLVVRIHSWNSPLGTHHGSLVNIGGISLLTELEKKNPELYKVLTFVFCLFELGVHLFLILRLFWRFRCSVSKFSSNPESFLFKASLRKSLKWKKMNGWRKKINN